MITQLIKKYGPVILVFIIVLVPVIFKGLTYSGFRYDASTRAMMPAGGENTLTRDELNKYTDNSLFVDLGPSFMPEGSLPANQLKTEAESVLLRKNFRTIRNHKGPVVIVSSEPSIAAKIWMILRQKGIKDIYILTDK